MNMATMGTRSATSWEERSVGKEMRISDWSSDVCSSDLRRGKPEGGDGNRDGEFEIVARGRERHCRRARIIALDQLAHEEADAELNHEVDGERNGDTQYVARQCHDLIALEAEHGDDGEQQCDERYRTYSGQETGFIPFVALGFHQPSARQKSSQKRYAEVRT